MDEKVWDEGRKRLQIINRLLCWVWQETPESECCSEGSAGRCSCGERSDKNRFCSAPFYRDSELLLRISLESLKIKFMSPYYTFLYGTWNFPRAKNYTMSCKLFLLLNFPVLWLSELNELSLNELNELLMELEAQIKDYSEVLIAELALRDELEFEKELKNSFISHLLAVQTKRRQHNLDRKKSSKTSAGSGDKAVTPNGTQPQQSKVGYFKFFFIIFYGSIHHWMSRQVDIFLIFLTSRMLVPRRSKS